MDESVRDNIGCIMCGNCKWFNCNADRAESICKRLDHKIYQFAKSWFKSYDCGQFIQRICRDFEPSEIYKYLYEHWTNFDDFIGEIPENEVVPIVINGDQSIRYNVRYKDFADGTFIDEHGQLKWIERHYYKKCKSTEQNPVGYILVHETVERQ